MILLTPKNKKTVDSTVMVAAFSESIDHENIAF